MGATFAAKVSRWQVAANVLTRAAEAGGFDDILELEKGSGMFDGAERGSGMALQKRADKIRERIKDLIGFLDDVRYFIEEGRAVLDTETMRDAFRNWAGGPAATVRRTKPTIRFNVGGYDGR